MMRQNLTWHIIPVLNPDGYAYSWNQDRFWRTNRSPTGGCSGVDLNRNFDANFGGIGSSKKCGETYRGTHAFSERESQAVRHFIQQRQKQTGNAIKMYLSIHSFSQAIIYPYGKDYLSFVPNRQELKNLAHQAQQAIFSKYGTQYFIGQTSQVLYPAAGGSDDWAYDFGNLDLSFTIELRDQGKEGFLLGPEKIRPVAEETILAIEEFAKHVIQHR